MEHHLNINQNYYNKLDLEGFLQMMKDPSFCYKFYWLEAIVQLISGDIKETTLDDIIDEMIANAWYSVREFHIHLSGIQSDGRVRDGLERAIMLLTELSDLPSNASRVEIKNEIRNHNDDLKKHKEQLTNMVPYRALAGFFAKVGDVVDWGSTVRMTKYIKHFSEEKILLPYTFGEGSKLKKQVYFDPEWTRMIQDNTVSILGWIQFEKVKWLQNNNPEVPGLVYKLAPLDEKMRKLEKVRKLWNGVLEMTEVRDVFKDEPIVFKGFDVDHFVPWSFVMNDELWNLMPMDPSLNSAKCNKLPLWDPFFRRFAANQFIMYGLVHQKPGLHKLFEGWYRDNLHSIWVGQERYRPAKIKELFYNILQKNMRPVYDSARRQGYEVWDCRYTSRRSDSET